MSAFWQHLFRFDIQNDAINYFKKLPFRAVIHLKIDFSLLFMQFQSQFSVSEMKNRKCDVYARSLGQKPYIKTLKMQYVGNCSQKNEKAKFRT